MSALPSSRHVGQKCQVSPPAFSSSDSDASDLRQPPCYEDAVKQVNSILWSNLVEFAGQGSPLNLFGSNSLPFFFLSIHHLCLTCLSQSLLLSLHDHSILLLNLKQVITEVWVYKVDRKSCMVLQKSSKYFFVHFCQLPFINIHDSVKTKKQIKNWMKFENN